MLALLAAGLAGCGAQTGPSSASSAGGGSARAAAASAAPARSTGATVTPGSKLDVAGTLAALRDYRMNLAIPYWDRNSDKTARQVIAYQLSRKSTTGGPFIPLPAGVTPKELLGVLDRVGLYEDESDANGGQLVVITPDTRVRFGDQIVIRFGEHPRHETTATPAAGTPTPASTATPRTTTSSGSATLRASATDPQDPAGTATGGTVVCSHLQGPGYNSLGVLWKNLLLGGRRYRFNLFIEGPLRAGAFHDRVLVGLSAPDLSGGVDEGYDGRGLHGDTVTVNADLRSGSFLFRHLSGTLVEGTFSCR